MFASSVDLTLTAAERQTLAAMLRATTLSTGVARWARVILALAAGAS